jgi:hypothetical protein
MSEFAEPGASTGKHCRLGPKRCCIPRRPWCLGLGRTRINARNQGSRPGPSRLLAYRKFKVLPDNPTREAAAAHKRHADRLETLVKRFYPELAMDKFLLSLEKSLWGSRPRARPTAARAPSRSSLS